MEKKHKILYVITKATHGGAQKYVHDLATNLPKERFEPMVAYGTPGNLSDDLLKAGIHRRQLPSLGRDVAILSDVKSFFEILRAVKELRPDIIHLNSSKAAALGALAARIAGVRKIVFTAHGWPFNEPRNPLSRMAIYFISWFTAVLSHKVIVVSDHDRVLAENMFFVGKKTIRIYNGIAPLTLGSGNTIRSSFPQGVQIIGTIGELTRNKNQITLIEKARKNPNMYVAVVGDGEDHSLLKNKIEEYGLQTRVKLFGFVPANEALPGFDVFTLPSLKEGLPYVLIEAKTAGLPIEANRVGGVSEILDAKDMSEFSLEKMLEKTVAVYEG